MKEIVCLKDKVKREDVGVHPLPLGKVGEAPFMISLGVWCWEFIWRHCLPRRRLHDALLQSRHTQYSLCIILFLLSFS